MNGKWEIDFNFRCDTKPVFRVLGFNISSSLATSGDGKVALLPPQTSSTDKLNHGGTNDMGVAAVIRVGAKGVAFAISPSMDFRRGAPTVVWSVRRSADGLPEATSMIRFSRTTGIFTIVPRNVTDQLVGEALTYVVNATNAGGHAAFTVRIRVIPGEPVFSGYHLIHEPPTMVRPLGSALECQLSVPCLVIAAVDLTGAPSATFTIEPPLSGQSDSSLSFNASSGSIWGTIATYQEPTVYTVHLETVGGRSNWTLAISFRKPGAPSFRGYAHPIFATSAGGGMSVLQVGAPGATEYSSELNFTRTLNQGARAIFNLTAGSPPHTFSVVGSGGDGDTSIPGLSMNLVNGAIWGVSKELDEVGVVVVVKAEGVGGSTTADVRVRVLDLLPQWHDEGGYMHDTQLVLLEGGVGGKESDTNITIDGSVDNIVSAWRTTTTSARTIRSPKPMVFMLLVNVTVLPRLETNRSEAGEPLRFRVDPPLPAGLRLDTKTGVVVGVPATVTARRLYTCTASNSGGGATSVLDISIVDRPVRWSPQVLTLKSSTATSTTAIATDLKDDQINHITLKVDELVTLAPLVDTAQGGAPLRYAVIGDTPLPAGFALDRATGRIVGRPPLSVSRTVVRLAASNTGGTVAARIAITVEMPIQVPRWRGYVREDIDLPSSRVVITVGIESSMSPVMNADLGSVPEMFLLAHDSTPFPTGLVLDTTTGTINGRVVSVVETTVRIVAISEGGAGRSRPNASFTLTVDATLPSLSPALEALLKSRKRTSSTSSDPVPCTEVGQACQPSMAACATVDDRSFVMDGEPCEGWVGEFACTAKSLQNAFDEGGGYTFYNYTRKDMTRVQESCPATCQIADPCSGNDRRRRRLRQLQWWRPHDGLSIARVATHALWFNPSLVSFRNTHVGGAERRDRFRHHSRQLSRAPSRSLAVSTSERFEQLRLERKARDNKLLVQLLGGACALSIDSTDGDIDNTRRELVCKGVDVGAQEVPQNCPAPSVKDLMRIGPGLVAPFESLCNGGPPGVTTCVLACKEGYIPVDASSVTTGMSIICAADAVPGRPPHYVASKDAPPMCKPVPPLLENVEFDPTGASIQLAFSVPTNEGSLVLSGDADYLNDCALYFEASAIQTFHGGACRWVDEMHIEVQLRSGETGDDVKDAGGSSGAETFGKRRLASSSTGKTGVSEGTVLTIRPGTITSKARNAKGQRLPADMPPKPVSVENVRSDFAVSLKGSQVIGRCDDAIVTAVASGTMGVDSPTFRWNVTFRSAGTNMDIAVQVADTALGGALTILRTRIPEGVEGTLVVTVAAINVFDMKATSDPLLSIKVLNIDLPGVILLSTPVVKIGRSDTLRIESSIKTAKVCGNGPASTSGKTPPPLLVWSIVTANGIAGSGGFKPDPQPFSGSVTSSLLRGTLLLRGGSLSAGTYVFALREKSLLPAETGTQFGTVEVVVAPSPLVAVISGGTSRLVPSSVPLVLNAAESFDPDDDSKSLDQLVFTWYCQIDGTGDPCVTKSGTVIPSRSKGGGLVAGDQTSVFPGELIEGTKMIITVSVMSRGSGSGSSGYRVANASQTVQVSAGSGSDPPIASIVTNKTPNGLPARDPIRPGRSVVNTDEMLILRGIATTKSATGAADVQLRWVVRCGNTIIISRPMENNNHGGGIVYSRASYANEMTLAIFPGSLEAGREYTFEFHSTSEQGATAATLDLVVNHPPWNGALTACAVKLSENKACVKSGFGLTTTFRLSVAEFRDDYRLAYDRVEYSYRPVLPNGTADGEWVVLIPDAALTTADVFFPAPPQGGQNPRNVEVRARVKDIFGSYGTAVTTISVARPELSTGELGNLVSDQVGEMIGNGDPHASLGLLSAVAGYTGGGNADLALTIKMQATVLQSITILDTMYSSGARDLVATTLLSVVSSAADYSNVTAGMRLKTRGSLMNVARQSADAGGGDSTGPAASQSFLNTFGEILSVDLGATLKDADVITRAAKRRLHHLDATNGECTDDDHALRRRLESTASATVAAFDSTDRILTSLSSAGLKQSLVGGPPVGIATDNLVQQSQRLDGSQEAPLSSAPPLGATGVAGATGDLGVKLPMGVLEVWPPEIDVELVGFGVNLYASLDPEEEDSTNSGSSSVVVETRGTARRLKQRCGTGDFPSSASSSSSYSSVSLVGHMRALSRNVVSSVRWLAAASIQQDTASTSTSSVKSTLATTAKVETGITRINVRQSGSTTTENVEGLGDSNAIEIFVPLLNSSQGALMGKREASTTSTTPDSDDVNAATFLPLPNNLTLLDLMRRGGGEVNETKWEELMPQCPGRRVYVWSELLHTTNVTAFMARILNFSGNSHAGAPRPEAIFNTSAINNTRTIGVFNNSNNISTLLRAPSPLSGGSNSSNPDHRALLQPRIICPVCRYWDNNALAWSSSGCTSKRKERRCLPCVFCKRTVC